MLRLYKFFDMQPVIFDDRKSVRELLNYVFEKSDYYEPAGMDIVTVYDASKYHVIDDTTIACYKVFTPYDDTIGHGNNGLCVAYYLPNLFFYAEGGWGHHMIEMDIVKNIKNPVPVNLRFPEFKNTVVLNGDITIRQIYEYLVNTNYINNDFKIFKFYEMLYGLPDETSCVPYNAISNQGKATIKEVCRNFSEPICIIDKF